MTRRHRQNVYDYLASIRARPSMYVRDKSLADVQTLLHGYYSALSVHGIEEGVPEVSRHFSSWLRYRFNWSLSCGWADAITQNAGADEAAFDRFFDLLGEYRALTLLPRYIVRLGPEHQPSGRRVVIGYETRMARPDAVEIVQYHPEPLFFLRLHYGERLQNEGVLFDNGREDTSVDFAMQWVKDELNVERSEWTPIAS